MLSIVRSISSGLYWTTASIALLIASVNASPIGLAVVSGADS
jgi:hypothetical protein